MRLIANSLNNQYLENIIQEADRVELMQIDLAVAYVAKMDSIFRLAEKRDVPLNLYALADGKGFPNLDVIRYFLNSRKVSWRAYLTRGYFHPKIMWFRGIGAYVGSANLTDKAWIQNIECGIWLDESELNRISWDAQLDQFFCMIAKRCTEATAEHLEALSKLKTRRSEINKLEAEFERQIESLLPDMPGRQAPTDYTVQRGIGGKARMAFREEWNRGLTILRKLTDLFDSRRSRWPEWVNQDASAAIVQDQATEWWWDNEFRHSGESRQAMLDSFRKNSGNSDAAVQRLLDSWCKFDGIANEEKSYASWINENPKELQQLLRIESLDTMNEDNLARLVFLCHSSREHARQLPNSTLELNPGEKRSTKERCDLFARYLWKKRSLRGRSVSDVLRFILWGDRLTGNPASKDTANRIWDATYDDEWSLPHLGVHIFGELLGYARPQEYPPRNNRVSKTLYALGFSGITYV